MPQPNHSPPISLDTTRGTFRVAVDGDAAAPALILSNSLGTTLEMWDQQVAAFSEKYRLIRYDARGHGGSPVTPGPYSFADLGQDVLAVLDALGIGRAAFCGISMGGHTGLWLGIYAASRFSAIAVCNSAARIGTPQGWNERAAMVREGGQASMQALAESSPGRWFSADFVSAHPAEVQRAQAWIAGIAPQGYAACCEALAVSDLRHELDRITTPTLLLAGSFDPVTTVADAQAMQAEIAGAQLAVVPASHLSNLEAPRAFDQAVLHFLANPQPAS
ncbi:3-oxoadipate enol-lactonase [Rhodoferax sp. OV413]|uniref:3-oxoadipate enol-lactonase n=1 Tax=Rhodoferax sp. OV413 TaxID=1855285 RepID=UPI00087E2A3A|nr:3-oxoadipate enol-lactonase [Rhodoferax sp. OV413]SDO37387.1 3-oxoadipate enol-lactonase [Rhodoferax sp. OV413]